MMNRPPRSVAAARWSLADVILIDEVADLLQRTPSRGHVIIDEAQDLSPMMLRAVGRRASTGSVTVLGDLAQATTPWATRSWRESLTSSGPSQRGDRGAGRRLPGAWRSDRFRGPAAAAYRAGAEDRRTRYAGTVASSTYAPPRGSATNWSRRSHRRMRNEGTVGVIVADAAVPGVRKLLERQQMDYDLLGEDPEIFDARAELPSAAPDAAQLLKPILVPASLVKGLEFDHVVLLEPAEIVAGEPDQVTGLRRLYVCLTRAVTSLVVVHAAELPALWRPEPRPTRDRDLADPSSENRSPTT